MSVIVLCDHGWVNGGQAAVAIDSALELKARGIDACFIAGTGPIDERLIGAGVECHAIGDYDILSDPNRLRAATRGLWNAAAARTLASCLDCRDERSTVIHVHGWVKALSASVARVVMNSRAAHVLTLHDYFAACPNGGFYDHGSGQICHRHPLGLACLTARCDPRASSHKAWRVARQAVFKSIGCMPKGLREIIAIAPEQRSIINPFVPADARWHYLPNPVGPRPRRRLAAERNKEFLFIGRLSAEKGAEIAAKAAKLADVPITFCGDGDRREAVASANPDARMLGWCDEGQLELSRQNARCLVFPSLWYEGYPLVLADALRTGLPVIVSKNVVAASAIADGVSGIHVAGGDIQGWADAMTRMKSDDVVRNYSKAAFSAGRDLLDSDQHTSALMEIYEKALARKAATATGAAKAIA